MWTNKNENNNRGGGFSGGFGGGGRGFRGGRSNRGRGGGRDFGTGSNMHGDTRSNESVTYDLCKFFVRSGNCRNGDNCRFVHNLFVVAFTVPAHSPQPIKSIGVLNTENGPKILTGSTDCTVKVWNLSSKDPSLEATIPATGKVEHILVDGNTIMWSTDEQISPDKPGITVGMVYLLSNPADMSTIAIKVIEFQLIL